MANSPEIEGKLFSSIVKLRTRKKNSCLRMNRLIHQLKIPNKNLRLNVET